MQNLANGIDSWFEEPYVMATLRMSRRSGQIELKSCVHLTDRIANFVTGMVANCCINWHLFVAKCAVPSGPAHRLCCSKRAVRICVAGGFNCTKGDPSLVAVTLHSHSRVYHVCKYLQLIYLSGVESFWHLYKNCFSSQTNEPFWATCYTHDLAYVYMTRSWRTGRVDSRHGLKQ